MKVNIILATLALSLSVIGCSSTNVASGGSNATQVAINDAKKAQKEAKKVGFEWRDMGKMIKKAEAAAKAGKDKKAIQIAQTVIEQGQQAQLQAKVAQTAGPRF